MRIVVIGAGIAGLLAAYELQAGGHQVTVLDKGRGVGGRMATRRIQHGIFDHGAQFFTVRSDRFGEFVRQWVDLGLVKAWSHGFATENGDWKNDGHTRYYGVQGMTTVPKWLARDMDVRLATTVQKLKMVDNQWHILLDDGLTLTADAVLATPPLPQTLALLADLPLTPTDQNTLAQLTDYNPTFTVLAVLAEASGLPEPGGMHFINPDSILAWMGDNTAKGISPDAHAITIHASTAYSRAHLDDDRQKIGEALLAEARHFLSPAATVVEHQTHRWLYSDPAQISHQLIYVVECALPLILAGDVFGGARIEGAALSGLAAADYLLAH